MHEPNAGKSEQSQQRKSLIDLDLAMKFNLSCLGAW